MVKDFVRMRMSLMFCSCCMRIRLSLCVNVFAIRLVTLFVATIKSDGREK